ncbi:MAG: D-glycero-beta-D-manno-heptose 1-phosphate adenylyltransferase, partial [Pseudomonadota bacterium]
RVPLMLIDDIQDRRIVVVGDVMLDHFVRGSVSRISPEAPTLVLNVETDLWTVGGAGNVAVNIATLGGAALLIGLVGDDAAADRLAGEVERHPRLLNRMVAHPSWPTIEKTRFIAGDNHLLRADRESKRLPDGVIEQLIARINAVAEEGCDGFVISDYAKGVVTADVIAAVCAAGARLGVPVVADPKRPNFAEYRGCTVLTPNRKELSMATQLPTDTDAEIAEAVPMAMAQFGGPIILTRSEQGISLFREDAEPFHDKPRNTALRDVSGAGDTVAATVALALAGGVDMKEAAFAANIAAGIAVGKSGTAAVSAAELMTTILHDPQDQVLEQKLVPVQTAVRMRAQWAEQGLKVGFTNGCFDIVHRGHVTMLRKCRDRCDKLIVALNTDASVSRLKGPERPIQSEGARADVIAAMEAVDMVLLFKEDTPLKMIEAIQPDRLFKGSDYSVDTVVGHEIVHGYGGEVVLIDLVEGYSTTRIVERSRAANGR